MESVKVVVGMLNSVLKASEYAHAANETLNTIEEQMLKFFNAMLAEISELENQSEKQKNYIIELETENKKLLAEIENLKKPVKVNSEPIEIPEN